MRPFAPVAGAAATGQPPSRPPQANRTWKFAAAALRYSAGAGQSFRGRAAGFLVCREPGQGIDSPAAPYDARRRDPARTQRPRRRLRSRLARCGLGYLALRHRHAVPEPESGESRSSPGGCRAEPAYRGYDGPRASGRRPQGDASSSGRRPEGYPGDPGGPSRAHSPHVAAVFASRPSARPRRIAPGPRQPAGYTVTRATRHRSAAQARPR